MNVPEIVGYAAMYVVGLVIIGYSLIMFMGFILRKRGLEAIPMLLLPTACLWIVGIIAGLILLGRITA